MPALVAPTHKYFTQKMKQKKEQKKKWERNSSPTDFLWIGFYSSFLTSLFTFGQLSNSFSFSYCFVHIVPHSHLCAFSVYLFYLYIDCSYELGSAWLSVSIPPILLRMKGTPTSVYRPNQIHPIPMQTAQIFDLAQKSSRTSYAYRASETITK